MRMIGLTGGIGSGKSTVAGYLAELGAYVIDADEGARAVVEPGTAGLEQLVEAFGAEILDGERLDRPKLAEIVFKDPAALATLNSITHPLIREWSAARVGAAAEEGREVVVQDIPLLFENDLDGLFAATILVWVSPETQLDRLLEGRGFDETDARARIARQLPIDAKRARATYVIDNSGTREATQAQTEKVWTDITAGRSTGP